MSSLVGFWCKKVSLLLLIVLNFSLQAQSLASIPSNANALAQAIANPEYMLKQELHLNPSAPQSVMKKNTQLTLREAILLALRYNPNIQNAELDRIIQRYSLRLAHNEFELQYALAGVAAVQQSRYATVGTSNSHSIFALPEVALKTQSGTTMSVNLANNYNYNNNYLPAASLSIIQPLLRGLGKDANHANLLNAIDQEGLNKVNLRQTVMDQITQVIFTYRMLIVSHNNLKNQKGQLQEAKNTFRINEEKIKAGQLEPTANVQVSYQIESLHLMVEQAENEAKITLQNLLQMIGLDPNRVVSVPDTVEVDSLSIPNRQQSIDRALTHNSQYLAQKILLRADERALKMAKNQQRWQLDLGANIQSGQVNDVGGVRGFQGIYNGQNTSQSASLTLSIPLNDVNRRAQLINARVHLEKDRLNTIAMKRALITAVTNSISTIESQAKRYTLAQKQVGLAQESYRLEKKKQQAGISSGLDVNNTQNQLIQAEAGLIAAKIAYSQ